MSIITNTTVLSNFASINQFAILRSLFSTLFLSTQVYAEIQRGREEGYHFYADIDQHIHQFNETGWLHLTSLQDEQELRLFGELPKRLHSGEASCIAIARCRGWTFLTDDRAARNQANRLGITVSGSLGCLVLAIESNNATLEQANSWLGEMMNLGYRSPVNDLAPLLKL